MADIQDKTGFEIDETNNPNGQDQGIGVEPEALETTAQIEDELDAPPDETLSLPPVHPSTPPPTASKRPGPLKPTKTDLPKSTQERKVMSVAVSLDEYEYLKKVFEARQESGLSNNWNHFLKQCLNYAVNWQKGWQFGVPANMQKVYLD